MGPRGNKTSSSAPACHHPIAEPRDAPQPMEQPNKWTEGVPGEWESASEEDGEADEGNYEDEAVNSAGQWPSSGHAEPAARQPFSVWAPPANNTASSSAPLSALG